VNYLLLKPVGILEGDEWHPGHTLKRVSPWVESVIFFLGKAAQGEDSSPSRRKFRPELSRDWWSCFCDG
jgi:hypothetical protein